MVLHKNVNGAQIQLSPEEEVKTRAEWAKNSEKKRLKNIAQEEHKQKIQAAFLKVKDKLNFTDEEMSLIFRS